MMKIKNRLKVYFIIIFLFLIFYRNLLLRFFFISIIIILFNYFLDVFIYELNLLFIVFLDFYYLFLIYYFVLFSFRVYFILSNLRVEGNTYYPNMSFSFTHLEIFAKFLNFYYKNKDATSSSNISWNLVHMLNNTGVFNINVGDLNLIKGLIYKILFCNHSDLFDKKDYLGSLLLDFIIILLLSNSNFSKEEIVGFVSLEVSNFASFNLHKDWKVFDSFIEEIMSKGSVFFENYNFNNSLLVCNSKWSFFLFISFCLLEFQFYIYTHNIDERSTINFFNSNKFDEAVFSLNLNYIYKKMKSFIYFFIDAIPNNCGQSKQKKKKFSFFLYLYFLDEREVIIDIFLSIFSTDFKFLLWYSDFLDFLYFNLGLNGNIILSFNRDGVVLITNDEKLIMPIIVFTLISGAKIDGEGINYFRLNPITKDGVISGVFNHKKLKISNIPFYLELPKIIIPKREPNRKGG